MGNASALSDQWRMAMLTFSTYPGTLFDGAIKLLLYSFIPAGFVTYLPVEALRSLSWVHAIGSVMGSVTILGIGIGVFYHGLRRYESGNLINMRG